MPLETSLLPLEFLCDCRDVQSTVLLLIHTPYKKLGSESVWTYSNKELDFEGVRKGETEAGRWLSQADLGIYVTHKSGFLGWTVRLPLPKKEESFFCFSKNKFESPKYLPETIEKGNPQLLLD